MKNKLIILIATICIATNAMAQEQVSALFGMNNYYLPQERKAYVETYLSFDANSMHFASNGKGQYMATADIVLLARQGDSVVYIKKYALNSPAITDSSQHNFNFLDLQRFYLANGSYTLELSVKDRNSKADAATLAQKINIDYNRKLPTMSKPQLMASVKKTEKENILSRSGYDMEPYVGDFIPEEISQLNIYYEVYNLQREIGSKPFLSYAYIEEQATGRRAEDIQHVARHNTNELVPVFTVLDIRNLPSGNYNLVVEIHDKNNETLLYSKLPFYRSNPSATIVDDIAPAEGTFAADINDETLLNYYLGALYAIASPMENQTIKELCKKPGLKEKQAFFYHFWQERAGLNAKDKWFEYRSWIEYTDKAFAFPHTPGHQTDRGRVYLQYGPPDFIRDEKNFVGALKLGSGTNMSRQIAGGVNSESQGHIHYLPYQLWRYNKLPTDDANRVFIFWDEFRSGLYKILVSNARGELIDPLWERRLSQQQLGEYVVGEVGEQFQRGY